MYNLMSASFSLRLQLQGLIDSMYNEGMVNEAFLQLQQMKTAEPPRQDYVIRTITSYCLACTTLFTSLSLNICTSKQQLDFQNIHFFASDLQARSSSVGAEDVRRACAQLLQACEKRDKTQCSEALYWIKHQFAYLRIKLEMLVELERRIIDLDNNQ